MATSSSRLDLSEELKSGGVCRIALEQLFQDLNGLLPMIGFQVHPAERDVSHFKCRIFLEQALQHHYGFVGLAPRPEHESQVIGSLSVVAAPINGLLKVGERTIQISLAPEVDTEVVESFRKVRLERQCLLIQLERLGRVAGLREREAQVVERVCKVWL